MSKHPPARPAGNRWKLPNLGIGVGLRSVHYGHILSQRPAVDWFEIISENYMATAGRPLAILDQISERQPLIMHGVALSIGSTDPLDRAYLRQLVALRERYRCAWLSDHLCWTGVAGKNSHDLLPMPYTRESLRHLLRRVKQVQDIIGAPLLLENPSTYVQFAADQMPEWEFLAELCERADCGIMLDVNNVYVSSRNHDFTPATYFDALPWDRVVQIHVSGHTDEGTHCVDTHIGPVIDPVWELLGEAWHRAGGASVLLEWDAEIPDFPTTHAEALRAGEFIAKHALAGAER